MKEFFEKIHTDDFTWRDSGFYVFVVTLLLVFLSGISSYPIQLLAQSSESSLAVSGLMYFSFITWWIVICLFCLIVKRYRYILKTFLKGMSGNTLKMFLCGLGIGFGTNTICVLCALFHKDIYLYFDSLKILPVLIMFLCVFVQSTAEELLYRGFMYQALRKGYKSPWSAILVNSFVFGFGHFLNPGVTIFSLFNVFLAGLLFSLLVYYFDSIWAAMAAHTAWNFTQNVLFGLPNSGMVLDFSIFNLDAAKATNSFFYNVAFGIEGTGMACVVLIVACAAIIILGNKKKKNLK